MAQQIVTIGADPELFLVDKSGQPVPACGLIGGTKSHPERMSTELPPKYTVQEDNVMVEFNIPPTKSSSGFVAAIQSSLHAIGERVGRLGLSISGMQEFVFPNYALSSAQAKQFGCSPDFNAHNYGETFPRIEPRQLTKGSGEWRFCGGHIHTGYKSEVPHFVAASFADVFIGLRMVGNDVQVERRKYYGQPGRYRPTAYGLEYRTPSNFWLFDTSAMIDIGNSAILFGSFLQTTPVDKIRKIYREVPWVSVVEAITTNNSGMAFEIRNFLNAECDLGI